MLTPDSGTSRRSPLQNYWVESRQPLISLVFVAPLLIVYEVGILLPGSPPTRNAADVWLRQLLELVGFGQYLLLPLLTCGILLAWHHTSHHSWRLKWSILWGMLLESILFAILLIVLANVQHNVMHQLPLNVTCAAGESQGVLRSIVMFCGAGIYEELLFRLMLLPILWWLFAKLRLGETRAPLLAIVVSSLLFSAAHYGPHGDQLELFSFAFRFLAGVFFSFLFYYRGFGIAAVAHTFYDIAVTFFI